MFRQVDEYISRVLVDEKGVPGCQITVMQDHELLHRYSAGYADREVGTPLTENTMYFMYSCTKPITVAAGLRLVEEGLLKLDAPVSWYLPHFANVSLRRDGKLVRPCNEMLVRHLFTMSAGYDYSIIADPYVREALEQYGDQITTMQVGEAFSKRPIDFEPGSKFNYSICHDILAMVIQQASGMLYRDYLDKNIFQPLEMKNSTFCHNEQTVSRVSTQYTVEEDRIVPAKKVNDLVLGPNYDSGGAGLITTVEDYKLFADAIACDGIGWNGYRLLKPETIRAMKQVHFTDEQGFESLAGPGYAYGLGVRVRTSTTPGSSPLGECGWDGAAGSYMMADTDNHLSVCMTMHVRAWPAKIAGVHCVVRDLVYQALQL